MLFEPEPLFRGLPEEGFGLFAIPARAERRRRILETLHPPLKVLGEDLATLLAPEVETPLHVHLPRLDWPRNYEPFCTWLALSYEPHGYQSQAQLNVGVHAGHVSVRLGWDTAAAVFGRFEFLSRIGHLDEPLLEAVREARLSIRVYATAPWPDGSRLVFESADDLEGSFREVHRRGVWWEIGHRYDYPAERDLICSERLGEEARRIFRVLVPMLGRIHVDVAADAVGEGTGRV